MTLNLGVGCDTSPPTQYPDAGPSMTYRAVGTDLQDNPGHASRLADVVADMVPVAVLGPVVVELARTRARLEADEGELRGVVRGILESEAVAPLLAHLQAPRRRIFGGGG